MILVTSSSLSVALVTGGSTGKLGALERFDRFEEREVSGRGVGVPALLGGSLERALPGDEARGAESHRRGDSCDGCVCVVGFCSSCGGCCI